jgi:phosphoadenosine phosphosulfate reductase
MTRYHTIDRSILPASLAQKSALATRLLGHVARDFAPAAFSVGLGAEDLVLLDLIAGNDLDIEPFIVDTGRLAAATYERLALAERHYGLRIRVLHPRHDLLEALGVGHAGNGFAGDTGAPGTASHARNVEPLGRALSGKRAWITGRRAGDGVARFGLKPLAHDGAYDVVTVNPLADWSEHEILAYIRAKDLPHDEADSRSYPAIGRASPSREFASGAAA